MVDGLERRIRRAAWCLAAVASVVAASLVVLPAELLHRTGLRLPAGGWLASSAGAAVLFALLSTMVASAPRRYAHLLPALAAATLGGVLAPAAESWGGALAALGAASLAAGLFALYLALWLADAPSDATQERDRLILRGVATTLVPPGGRIAVDAGDPRIEQAITEAYRHTGPWGAVRLRLTLRLVDVASWRMAGASFWRAEVGARELVLERLLAARRALFRRPVEELRETILARFYADPRVQAAIGFDGHHLRTRLEQGPNASAHAAALFASSVAATEAHPEGEGPAILEERGSMLRLVRVGPVRP